MLANTKASKGPTKGYLKIIICTQCFREHEKHLTCLHEQLSCKCVYEAMAQRAVYSTEKFSNMKHTLYLLSTQGVSSPSVQVPREGKP